MSTTVSAVPVVCCSYKKGEPPPTQADKDFARSQADNLCYPSLPDNTVIYGQYKGSYGQYIWCEHCEAWVGWYQFKQNSNTAKINEPSDGACAHFNAEIRNILMNHRVT